jgi:hypothetical protein
VRTRYSASGKYMHSGCLPPPPPPRLAFAVPLEACTNYTISIEEPCMKMKIGKMGNTDIVVDFETSALHFSS